MASLHRLTTETLNLLRLVAEDQSEDRIAYRNELRRLSASGLSLAFSEYEHFLERYGYWSLDARLDAFKLSAAGLEATRGEEARLHSLDEDVRHHFHKDLEEVEREAPVVSGQRFDQHYIRFEAVGRGGVGSVWRGEHLKSGRPVAIKTLEGLDEVLMVGRKSTLKKKIERVMRASAQLTHPFITPVLDLSVHHTPPYYVMPLCTGGSLRDLIAAGPISPELGLNIFAQVCLALQHAHERGVLHLDLKPENILLDASGNAQLFDFGLSRVVAKQVSRAGRQSYVGFGSVAYMPPELMRDPLLEASTIDIYALGLVLYEILVGELPGRRSPMPSEVIKDLPTPIDDLFDAMVQDHPSRRPQSMTEVLDVLNRVAPFDRLSQNSMVLLFNRPPVTLPGLRHLELPDLPSVDSEEAQSERAPVSQAASLNSKPQGADLLPKPTPTPTPAPAVVSSGVSALSAERRIEVLKSLEPVAEAVDEPTRVAHVRNNLTSSAPTSMHDRARLLREARAAKPQNTTEPQAPQEPTLLSSSPQNSSPRHPLRAQRPHHLEQTTPSLSESLSGERMKMAEEAELIEELDEVVELDDVVEFDDFEESEATALHDQPSPAVHTEITQSVTPAPKAQPASLQERLSQRYQR